MCSFIFMYTSFYILVSLVLVLLRPTTSLLWPMCIDVTMCMLMLLFYDSCAMLPFHVFHKILTCLLHIVFCWLQLLIHALSSFVVWLNCLFSASIKLTFHTFMQMWLHIHLASAGSYITRTRTWVIYIYIYDTIQFYTASCNPWCQCRWRH